MYKDLKSVKAVESNRRKNKKYSQTQKGKESRKKAELKRQDDPNRQTYVREYQRKYRSSLEGKKILKGHELKHKHNINLDAYNELFEKQSGKCVGCLKTQTNRMLCVDHDHKCCPGKRSCGKCIRGLLCHKCNSILGYCSDSILVLQNLIQYLKNSQFIK